MDGGKRALIVSVLLFVLWGTFICAPFRNFVRAIRWLSDQSAEFLHASAPIRALLVTAFFMVVIIAYLFFRQNKAAEYTAVFAGGVGVVFHLAISVIHRAIAGMAVPVVIGLMAAMIFMLFQMESATRFLSDAFFYAIPVNLFYEWVMVPVFSASGLRGDLLSPFITVGTSGFSTEIGKVFGIPEWVWGLFVFIMTLLPVIYLSKGRAPSKRDYIDLRL